MDFNTLAAIGNRYRPFISGRQLPAFFADPAETPAPTQAVPGQNFANVAMLAVTAQTVIFNRDFVLVHRAPALGDKHAQNATLLQSSAICIKQAKYMYFR